MRKMLAVLSLALLSGCSSDAPTAVAVPQKPNAALYNPDAPVPVLLSAVRVSTDGNSDVIRLTFTDTAADETLVSAYFTGCASFAVTANIAPGVVGETRSVDVPAYPVGYCTARLRYLWNPTPEIQDSWTWGPFSGSVAVTEGAPTTITSTKKKGRK